MNKTLPAIERAVLVHVNFSSEKMAEDLDEFKELTSSAGAEIVSVITTSRSVPDAKYFVGSGKAEEIRDVVKAHKADLVLCNHALSPAQERNLERLIQCRVLDRTGLILDIFAKRARSFEGKLQVELALLKHLATRLIRGWTHLERQRGGIGLRGPGETQLEVDRRLIRNRIRVITARLNKIRKQRAQGRKARRKAVIPTIALVGYTNAGKSTLFNSLTGADVYAADQLFATLDPSLRRVDVPDVGPVILADTVGFIRHLPHELIAAFQATLEEVSDADLLLHIVDAHDENRERNIEQVTLVLEAIGAKSVPQILVYNKIDLCPQLSPKIDKNELGQIKRVYISASHQIGYKELMQAISLELAKDMVEKWIVLLPNQAKIRARLYAHSTVLSEEVDDEGHIRLLVRMSQVELDKLLR